MIPRLESATYLGGYCFRLVFSDGTKGELDLEDQLWSEIFEPIRDPDEFRRFEVHHELNTFDLAERGGFRTGVSG